MFIRVWAQLQRGCKNPVFVFPQWRQRGTEVASSCKGYTNQTTHISTQTLIEQAMTGHIIVSVKHVMYFQFTWQGGLGTSQCVFVFDERLASPCIQPQCSHCRIVHWSRNVAPLFICQLFWHRGGGYGVMLGKAGKSINNKGFRVRQPWTDVRMFVSDYWDCGVKYSTMDSEM